MIVAARRLLGIAGLTAILATGDASGGFVVPAVLCFGLIAWPRWKEADRHLKGDPERVRQLEQELGMFHETGVWAYECPRCRRPALLSSEPWRSAYPGGFLCAACAIEVLSWSRELDPEWRDKIWECCRDSGRGSCSGSCRHAHWRYEAHRIWMGRCYTLAYEVASSEDRWECSRHGAECRWSCPRPLRKSALPFLAEKGVPVP